MTRLFSYLPLFSVRGWPRLAAAVLLLIGSLSVVANAQEGAQEVTEEYQLKAALLYKLTKFVSWPEAMQEKQRFNFCILGDNVFGNSLEPLRERQVSEKAIDVNYYQQSDEVDVHCNLLFIERSKQPFLSSILNRFDRSGILTISDINGFAEQGGIVELTLVDNKVGFRINLGSSKAAELSLAAPLLQLATIVDDDNGGHSVD